jgi:hypothetical protein
MCFRISSIFLCVLVVCYGVVSGILTGCSADDLSGSMEAQEARTFVAQHHQALDFSDPNSALLLESALANNELFMAGEFHSVSTNEDVNFLLLRYFHQRAGIRYCLPEFSFAFCEIINAYLEQGDEALLRALFDQFRGTAAYHKEGFEFWRKLRAYNQTLLLQQRIRVVGTDIEHQHQTALRYYRMILPVAPAPTGINDALQGMSILFGANFTPAQLLQRCQALRSNIDANRSVYQQYFGNNFFNLDFLISNLIQTIDVQSRSGDDFNRVRDNYMYANFLRIYPTLPKGKMYGEWGRNHIYQTRANDNILWNGSMLANDAASPVRGKVLSIAYLYQNCSLMNRDNGSSQGFDDYSSPEKILDSFVISSPTPTARLFRLQTPIRTESPFSKYLLWLATDTGFQRSGAVTTDYYQYAVLIQNAPAATRYAP